jgi:hypothetical protein
MTQVPDELLAVTLARIETKLDNAIHLGGDHERRLRTLEDQAAESRDHEARVKVLESRVWPLPSMALLVSVAAFILPLVR